jgi:hypothetical protein
MSALGQKTSQAQGIRWGWLKAIYILTVVVAGGFGLGMIFAPSTAASFMEISCDAAPFGIVGSVYLAFGLLSLLGLRDPLKFVPVLLLQLTYKAIWLLGVALPLLIKGMLPASEISTVVLFSIIVAGDLVAIPFRYLFTGRRLAA